MSRDMIAIRSYCQDEIIYLQQFIIDTQQTYIKSPNRVGEFSSELTDARTRIMAYKRVINHIDSIAAKHMKQEDQHNV